ncbi:MAG TPA: hypothetical protein VF720_10505 [Candidatus Eisenbacteria bacterium]
MTMNRCGRRPWLIAAAMGITAGGLCLPPGAEARIDLNDPANGARNIRAVYANRDPYIFTHNVGLLTLQITNIGIIGNPFIDELSAGWRGGEYLYLGGLWLGAIGEDQEPHVSTAVPVELRPSLLPVDTIYESYEGIRGGNRNTEALDADDDDDGLEDEDFHNGKDDDLDGQVDEDYAAIGQQMYSCEYRDNTTEATNQLNEHRPLGLLVHQRSFQWATNDINEFVGFEFEVTNIGDQRLQDMFIGFNVDADAGPKSMNNYWTDDLVGFVRVDTLDRDPNQSGQCANQQVSMDIAYIWDAPDNGTTIVGGDVPGYFGGMFLGHTTDPAGVKAPVRVGLSTVKWTSSTGAYPQGDPRTDAERYDLLSRREIPTRNANKPDDYRFTLSAGPFLTLDPGDKLVFQTAFVIGEGLQGMITNAVNAQRVFNGQYLDADGNPETGVEGKERCLIAADPRFPVMWDDPCDTLGTTVNISFRTCIPAAYVDDDCNSCTGIGGKEALLNWVGTTAPPPPATNTDPELFGDPEAPAAPNSEIYLSAPQGDRRVILQWDNVSELSRDPITGNDIFEGYKIWRVDNWQRPEGSIGPTPQEWMQVAEFRKNPRDKLGSNSPRSLRRVLHPERDEIKQTTQFGPQYYIGRYEWQDSSGITNGKVYFYAITAFGVQTRRNPVTGLLETIELGGSPTAVQKEVVVASWKNGTSCDQVKVVPNPYRGGADWDLEPSDCDPTGTKIAIRNLPEGWTRLRIYSLTGDLIIEADPSDSRVVGTCDNSAGNLQTGTFYWDLITRSGQNVVAGVYLYVVEAPVGSCRGRFVVIR